MCEHKGEGGDNGRICHARRPQLEHALGADEALAHANGTATPGKEQPWVRAHMAAQVFKVRESRREQPVASIRNRPDSKRARTRLHGAGNWPTLGQWFGEEPDKDQPLSCGV